MGAREDAGESEALRASLTYANHAVFALTEREGQCWCWCLLNGRIDILAIGSSTGAVSR
jgi:hypothetical protein